MVVFSGFGASNTNRRSYNYLTHLTKFKTDLLFILDTWGIRGSYYILEAGDKGPMKTTSHIIEKIINKKFYSKTVFCGSSKGGSAALIFGLKYRCDYIISGACQYHIGKYISSYPDILEGMVGKKTDSKTIKWLDTLIHHNLEANSNNDKKPVVTLIYSKKEIEQTYQSELIDLISDLEKYGYTWNDEERDFESHGMIGVHFIDYMNSFLPQLINP